jgi:hypothetical protein
LGLKERFGGGVDHLQTAFQTEPVPDSDRTPDYLYLFDTVPGGTGYLKVFAVFENLTFVPRWAGAYAIRPYDNGISKIQWLVGIR